MKNFIVWFRQDLRIRDNPALLAAAEQGRVLPVYIHDEKRRIGQASRWWLHHSLISLNKALLGNLNIYRGSAVTILSELAERFRAGVYWNRCYEPSELALSQSVEESLFHRDIEAVSFNGTLLWEPFSVVKNDGAPYKVFTPYYRAAQQWGGEPSLPCGAPAKLSTLKDSENSTNLDELSLLPAIPWYRTIEKTWQVGEQPAEEQLQQFINHGLNGYAHGRDFPAQKHSSRLSPYLHFGEIAPNTIWHAISRARTSKNNEDVDCFLKELAWREFSNYQLFHFPSLPVENFDEAFDAFAWRYDRRSLRAWQRGQTGFPLVDAGMRELWQTGFMHNRVRMVTASFLVKNLLIHWREGEAWFFDCLVDADLANNCANWQWVAGCGADAAPFFRIFNPTTQGEKFDELGEYTRRFVPELAQLPNKYLFRPWDAPDDILKKASIILGKTYPRPLVDLAKSRERALAMLKRIRRGKAGA